MTTSQATLWVEAQSYDKRKSASGGSFFLILATDEKCNRYRIYCDERFEDMIVHFLVAMNKGIKKMIPIEPRKNNKKTWYVALDAVDETPPTCSAFESAQQLSIPPAAHVSTPNASMKKESFRIDCGNASKASFLAKRLGVNKSKFYADVIGAYIKVQEQADLIF
jgi:hypothetical protein